MNLSKWLAPGARTLRPTNDRRLHRTHTHLPPSCIAAVEWSISAPRLNQPININSPGFSVTIHNMKWVVAPRRRRRRPRPLTPLPHPSSACMVVRNASKKIFSLRNAVIGWKMACVCVCVRASSLPSLSFTSQVDRRRLVCALQHTHRFVFWKDEKTALAKVHDKI